MALEILTPDSPRWQAFVKQLEFELSEPDEEMAATA
jgi:hypothetical protein